MSSSADFDALLTGFRAAGLRVGVSETLYANYLMSRLAASPRTLQHALRALIIKSDQEQEVFDRVFDEWTSNLSDHRQPQSDHVTREAKHAVRASVKPALMIRSDSSSRLSHSTALIFWTCGPPLLLFLVIGFVSASGWSPFHAPKMATELGLPAEKLISLQPQLFDARPPMPLKLIHGLLVAAVFMLLGGFLFLGLRRRRYLPLSAPLPTRPGATRLYPEVQPTHTGLSFRLLDAAAQDALAFGVGQFVSEQPTHRLDVARCVLATAGAGGVPSLHFLRARQNREVFLWLDLSMSATDPAAYGYLSRLADEAEETLRRSGLPVERATFWGIPDRLELAVSNSCTPSDITQADLDERREHAIVAILTDGRKLQSALHSEERCSGARTCLRALSHWPRLAFVDSAAAPTLRALLHPFEIPVISPTALPAFFCSQPDLIASRARVASRPSAVLAWAATLALAPEPVSEDMANAVRKQLGLDARPEALTLVRRRASCQTGPLVFPLAERARLLAWLLHRETIPGGSLRDLPTRLQGSLLGRALAMWRDRIKQEFDRRGRADKHTPFYGTLGEQHLYLQQSLLDLWDCPEAGAEAIYRLYHGVFREDIRVRLAAFVPQECEQTADRILLPWRLSSLPPLSQQLLLEMGFGGDMLAFSAVPLRRPGRVLLAWAGCAGLVLASLLWAWIGEQEWAELAANVQIFRVSTDRSKQWDIYASISSIGSLDADKRLGIVRCLRLIAPKSPGEAVLNNINGILAVDKERTSTEIGTSADFRDCLKIELSGKLEARRVHIMIGYGTRDSQWQQLL